MKIIDLTLPMYTGMSVYPGDPEVSIEVIQTIDKHGWNMRRIQMNSHDGTHVNAQNHGIKRGKCLNEYALERFCGPARIYTPSLKISPDEGLIFRDQNVTAEISQKIRSARPRFVGLSSNFEFNVDIEKELLKADILIFERLANTELLPDSFSFYGMPLKIEEGDGSPIRAFAIVD